MKAARVVRTGGRPKRTCTRRHLAGGRPVCKSLLVRGLNALAATISTPLAAPVIAATRLRGGNAASARGAASFAAEAISTARGRPGAPGRSSSGLDSAYYSAAVMRRDPPRRRPVLGHRARWTRKIRAAIAAIRETAWTPIRYPRAIWDDQLGCWISDAEVAEMPYTAFASKKGQAITARLIVRRVRDLNKQGSRRAGRAVSRLALPRRVHRLPVRAGPGRGAAPRPRHRGAGLRRLDRRAACSPAIRVLPRERRLAGLRRHRAQPAPRRRLPGQPAPTPGPAAPPSAAT